MQKKLLAKIRNLWLGSNIKKIIFISAAAITAVVICAFAVASACATAAHKQTVFKSCEIYTRFMKIGMEAELKALTNNLSVYINEPIIDSGESLYTNGTLDSSLTDKILKKLRTTAAANNLIKDIGVTFYNHPIVITQSGFFSSDFMRTSDSPRFATNDFDYKSKNIVHMEAIAGSKNGTATHDLFLYFITDEYRMTISVDVKSFLSRVKNARLYDDGSIILVMNSAGKIILTDDYTSALALDKQELFDTESLSFTKDYLVVKEKGENNLIYTVVYDKNIVKKDISSINTYYIAAYSITLLILLAFLWLINNILITPLKNFASNCLAASGSGKKNEFAALLDYVEIMNQQIFEMSDYILYTKDTTNNGMMINAILTGSADKSSHEYSTYKNNFFKDAFPHSKFMLMYFITGSADKSYSTGLSVVFDALNAKYEYCFIADDGFFVVINFNGSGDAIKRSVKKYIDDCNKTHIHIVALVSDTVDNIDSIWECTNQLTAIKTGRNVMAKAKLYTSADIASEKHLMALFVENESEIMNLITTGDSGKLKEFLDMFFKHKDGCAYSDCYALFMYLHNFIIRASQRTSADVSENHIPYAELMASGNLSVIDFESTKDSFCRSCMMLCESASNYENDYEDEIIRYIKDNYNKFISLDLVAQKFQLNPSYLSTYIKKKIGMSFVEYMRILRIGNAKKLLTETDMDISEISEVLGFTDTSSFIRYFKKSEETTPKQYRTAHKKGR